MSLSKSSLNFTIKLIHFEVICFEVRFFEVFPILCAPTEVFVTWAHSKTQGHDIVSAKTIGKPLLSSTKLTRFVSSKNIITIDQLDRFLEFPFLFVDFFHQYCLSFGRKEEAIE
jgi:hypothetical protein